MTMFTVIHKIHTLTAQSTHQKQILIPIITDKGKIDSMILMLPIFGVGIRTTKIDLITKEMIWVGMVADEILIRTGLTQTHTEGIIKTVTIPSKDARQYEFFYPPITYLILLGHLNALLIQTLNMPIIAILLIYPYLMKMSPDFEGWILQLKKTAPRKPVGFLIS